MTTVEQLFRAAGVDLQGSVPWGAAIPIARPGVYVVSTSADAAKESGPETCPVDLEAVRALLQIQPDATVDGTTADIASVDRRLRAMWVPLNTVVYIGLAGTSLQKRICEYYRTKIGARAPHAGGWPIKMLAILNDLTVHYGESGDPQVVDATMIDAFVAGVDDSVRSRLTDPSAPLPFANLMFPSGQRKRHGFGGVQEPRTTTNAPTPDSPDERSTPEISSTSKVTNPGPGSRPTQNVTAKDVEEGQIRVPSATKSILPPEADTISVTLRGVHFSAKWKTGNDPDKERSGVIRIPAADLRRLVTPGGPLRITGKDEVYEIQ